MSHDIISAMQALCIILDVTDDVLLCVKKGRSVTSIPALSKTHYLRETSAEST